jgi:hypothetical protein
MKYLLFAIACLFIVDAVAPAFAQTKTCTNNGNSRTCTKSCY